MTEDDVLREVRAAREAYARSHGFDFRAMVADLHARDLAGDWLYEAAAKYSRAIVPYLALPAGVLLAVTDAVLTIFHDGEPLKFKPGSFLAARDG